MSGNLTAAAHWARRNAGLAPESESALCRVITLLERAGDRAAALRAYDEFADRLASEYEAEPSAETRALMRAVRARANAVSSLSIANTSLAVETRTNAGLARESSTQHLRLQPAEHVQHPSAPVVLERGIRAERAGRRRHVDVVLLRVVRHVGQHAGDRESKPPIINSKGPRSSLRGLFIWIGSGGLAAEEIEDSFFIFIEVASFFSLVNFSS